MGPERAGRRDGVFAQKLFRFGVTVGQKEHVTEVASRREDVFVLFAAYSFLFGVRLPTNP